MRFFRRRPLASRDLACREAAELVADALDDLLPPDQAARLRRHLDGCADCSEYLAQLRIVRDLARRDAGGSLDDATRSALSDLYRDWRGG